METLEQPGSGAESSHVEPTPIDHTASSTTQEQAQALYEIDKLDKFKYQGKEWTPKDLEKAILRQEDYTKKTTSLAEQRKTFESEQKYYENLAADLLKVQQDSRLIDQFIKIYPQKFHAYLQNMVSPNQGQQPHQPPQNQPDIQMLSRLDTLEKFYNEQQVTKNEVVLNRMLDSAQKKFPNAIPDLALARLYDLHTNGQEVTDELVDQVYKQVQDQMDAHYKARYSATVKQQTQANKKARGDGAGGGVSGEAPKKFKSLREVTEHAIATLKQGQA